jgi:hypothetical protein
MLYVKQGDRRPAATQTLTRGGVVIDLTLATGVTFKMRERGRAQGDLKVNTAASIADAVNGVVSYGWQTGDTDTPGTYYAEWEVVWNDGTQETFPTLGYEPVLVTGDNDG